MSILHNGRTRRIACTIAHSCETFYILAKNDLNVSSPQEVCLSYGSLGVDNPSEDCTDKQHILPMCNVHYTTSDIMYNDNTTSEEPINRYENHCFVNIVLSFFPIICIISSVILYLKQI